MPALLTAYPPLPRTIEERTRNRIRIWLFIHSPIVNGAEASLAGSLTVTVSAFGLAGI